MRDIDWVFLAALFIIFTVVSYVAVKLDDYKNALDKRLDEMDDDIALVTNVVPPEPKKPLRSMHGNHG